MARVTGIDPEKKVIKTLVGELEYDLLVIANGSKTNYFRRSENVRAYISYEANTTGS